MCRCSSCKPFSAHASLIFTQMVSLLLIGVAAWGKWFGLVSSIGVVAGVIGVGAFLLLVAFVGLCGAVKHHQVLLFFVSFVLIRQDFFVCAP